MKSFVKSGEKTCTQVKSICIMIYYLAFQVYKGYWEILQTKPSITEAYGYVKIFITDPFIIKFSTPETQFQPTQ